MIHKTPEADTWDLTMRSHKLWKTFAEGLRDQGLDPLQVLGWKQTGSLLFIAYIASAASNSYSTLKIWIGLVF